MRIIAGRFRSQPLVAPKGWRTRPTSDKLRQTLFNVWMSRIEGAVFADLFAGTGAVGIEAWSRGARQVYFAETAKPALAALRANLERFDPDRQCIVGAQGALPLLRALHGQGARLDLVFLDPPYESASSYESVLKFLAGHPILSNHALVVAEHSRRRPLPDAFLPLKKYRTLEQGDSTLSFYRSMESPTE